MPLSWFQAFFGDDALGDLLLDDGVELQGVELGYLGPLLVEESHVFQTGALVSYHSLPRHGLSSWGKIARQSSQELAEVREGCGVGVPGKLSVSSQRGWGRCGPRLLEDICDECLKRFNVLRLPIDLSVALSTAVGRQALEEELCLPQLLLGIASDGSSHLAGIHDGRETSS